MADTRQEYTYAQALKDGTPANRYGTDGSSLKEFQRDYISTYAPYAMLLAQQTGIPARSLLAEIALETNWGRSGGATKANNLFGVKASEAQIAAGVPIERMGTWEYDKNGNRYWEPNAAFIKYDTPGGSFQGFADKLQKTGHDTQRDLFNDFSSQGNLYAQNDGAELSFANAFKKSGYLSNPAIIKDLLDTTAAMPADLEAAGFRIAPSFDTPVGQFPKPPSRPTDAQLANNAGTIFDQNGIKDVPLPPGRPDDGSAGITPRPPGGIVGAINDASDAFTQGLEGVGNAALGAGQSAFGALGRLLGIGGDPVQVARPDDYGALAALYQQNTGRSPDVDGFNYWGKALEGGQSLFQIDQAMRNSAESKAYLSLPSTDAGTYNPATGAGALQPSQILDTAYNVVLGRPADASGSDYWSQPLQNGTSLAGLMDALMQSPEYAQTHPAQQTPTLGNTGTTPTQGVSSFADLINNAYQATLQRPAETGAVDYWTQALQNGSVSPDAIQQALTQSPEYEQTHPAQQVPTIGPNGTVTATTPNVQAIDPIDVGTYSPLVGPQTANTIGAGPTVATFDPSQYLQANPDVAAAGVNPLQHWLQYGQAENRALDLAGDRFNSQAYLAANQDVALSGMNPLAHYLQYGMGEGRAAPIVGPDGTVSNVQNYVNASTYAPSDWASILNTAISTPTLGAPALSPTISNAVDAPIVTNIPQAAHVWSPAETPTLSPTEFAKAWSPEEYLNANQDVRAAGLDPLQHYLQFGINENRAIDTKGDRLPVTFNSTAYLAANPDVAKAGLNPLAHFLTSGADEGRTASWDGNPYSFSSLQAGGYQIPNFTPATPAANYAPLDDLVAREGPAGGPVGSSGTAGFLADQINQLNQNVQQSANVERMLAPNGIPIPVFAQNQFAAGAAPQTAVNQNAYLNQVNTALGNMAPAAPSGASFLPKPVMSGPFW